MSHDLLPDWLMTTLTELARQAPFGKGRVQLGFGFDGFFLPKEMITDVFTKVNALGIKLITCHYARGLVFGNQSRIAALKSYGLMDEAVLFSDASNATFEDARIRKEANGHVSCTPSTELQMAMGQPIVFSDTLILQTQCSIGSDTHAATSASIPNEMRILLQSSRATYNQPFVDSGKAPKRVNKTVEDVFNLGTIQGARAIGMSAVLGSLAEGKYADLIVFDSMSPRMVCASQKNPVAAIVLHSSPEDMVMTMVDGVVRKENNLTHVEVLEEHRRWSGKGNQLLSWQVIANDLATRSEKIEEKIRQLDLSVARGGMIQQFHIDPAKIVDEIPYPEI